MNLTTIRSDAEIIQQHFIDSAMGDRLLPPDCDALADIGSGAGLPGLPRFSRLFQASV